MLIATFLSFWLVRDTYDPCVKLRTTREGAQAVARCEENLGLNKSVPRAVQRRGSATRSRATSARAHGPTSPCRDMLPSAMWNTCAADLLRHRRLGVPRALPRRVLRGPAVLARPTTRSRRSRSSGSRCRRSGSACSRSSSSRSARRSGSASSEPIFYLVGLHTPGPDRVQHGLRAPSRAAGAHPDRAVDRVVEPVPTDVDARRAVEPTTSAPRAPRACRGVGDLEARHAQRARSRS